jgi:hypothetical protein
MDEVLRKTAKLLRDQMGVKPEVSKGDKKKPKAASVSESWS